MKAKFLFVALILVGVILPAAKSQWVLLDEDSPPLLTTDALAKPNSSDSSPMWSNGKNLYLLNDHLWKYEIDGKRWLWQCPTGISERKYAAYWSMRGVLYLFGGQSESSSARFTLADMWTYDPKTRTAQSVPSAPGAIIPTARYGSSFWTHEPSNRLYLFGGIDGNATSAPLTDLYAYDIIAKTWSVVQYTGTVDILPFASATMHNGNAFLYSNDRLWQLDQSTGAWSQVAASGGFSPPGPSRMHHILWSDGTFLYLYGGESGSKLFGDLWKYAPGGVGWSHLSEKIVPPARSSPSHVVDIYGSLFMTGGSEYNDLWGYGPISELSLLEKLENGLQSSILWSFTAAVIAGIVLLLIIGILFYICILRCVSTKKNIGHTPLIMTRMGKNGEEFVGL